MLISAETSSQIYNNSNSSLILRNGRSVLKI